MEELDPRSHLFGIPCVPFLPGMRRDYAKNQASVMHKIYHWFISYGINVRVGLEVGVGYRLGKQAPQVGRQTRACAGAYFSGGGSGGPH